MLIPKHAWKRKIGEPFKSLGICKVTGLEGGLPNIDDGCYQGIPLGGFGAGVLSQNYRGDFSLWQLNIGKHNYKIEPSCQFGISENGKAFILNENKPKDVLSTWNFQKQNGTYHALYPRAYFEYEDIGIIQKQFSPIIPNNYSETSFPVGVFKFEITNNKNVERELSLLWSFKSPLGSKDNFFYQENSFSGIIFDNLKSELDENTGQLGIFVQREDVEISYITLFDENGDGNEVWNPFAEQGLLLSPDDAVKEKNKTNSPAAICAKVKIPPVSKKIFTFVIAWDFPIFESGNNVKWFKRYTKFFGKDGRNVTKIARKAFGESEKWELDIEQWQQSLINDKKLSEAPDWLHTFLINELYYLAAGGTLWTAGKMSSQDANILRQEEHFGILECHDYPFYETLDVRFYGSFPLLKLWPELEKIVLKDYIKSILKEDLEEKKFDHPLASSTGVRKIKGACPHDLGMPSESPFIKYNAYPHVDINKWKDLNSKFILLIYRYFYCTRDVEFLESAWDSMDLALNYLKDFDRDGDSLIENEGIPDQTYDNWSLKGPGSYCNGLWLASLSAMVETAKILQKDCSAYKKLLEVGKKNLNECLWNGEYFLLDTQEKNKEIVMADILCGQWYADLLGLGEIFESNKVDLLLKKIFKLNVLRINGGKRGAINAIKNDGTLLLPSQVWKQNTQWNEIWTGTTLALSSHMYLRDLKEEALKTAEGIYLTAFEEKGYVFRTPEAWDVDGNFRASMYHRPGAIWAYLFCS